MKLFSRIVIVGVGLMGGSVGLAVRKRDLAQCVVGIDPDRWNLSTALDRGAIDLATTDFEEGVRCLGGDVSDDSTTELVVVATPVGQVADCVRRTIDVLRNSATRRNVLITDVGSTKQAICSQLDGLERGLLSEGCRFIGSHPIAGSERSGPEYSDENLFEKRLTLVAPSDAIRDHDLGLLVRFWQRLGSSVLCMSPEDHDRVLARTSHLPHLLSALLAEGLRRQDVPFTGSGFRSTTRLAAGGPSMWSDIVSTNPTAILEAIRDFETGLQSLRDSIERQAWPEIAAFLESAKRNRDGLDENARTAQTLAK